MLPAPLFAVLLLTIFLSHIGASEAAYLRAHKREPFLVLATVVGVLTGVSTLVNGKLWGAEGVVIGYLICGGFIYLTGGSYIFVRFRQAWHRSESSDAQRLV
jgi:O-antigen/teichoic acid export membrane protein